MSLGGSLEGKPNLKTLVIQKKTKIDRKKIEKEKQIQRLFSKNIMLLEVPQ